MSITRLELSGAIVRQGSRWLVRAEVLAHVLAVIAGCGRRANYALDAQELLPDMPPIVGRDAIRAFYEGVIVQLPRFAHSFTVEAITMARSGDLAVTRGAYRFTADTLEPQEVQNGKYVGVWRYRNGEWRLAINISNGNEPRPGS